MKKNRVFICVFIVVLAVCLILCSCNDDTKYRVSYSAGNGEAVGTAPASADFEAGDTVTVAENTFSLTGYTFAGWKCNDTTYAPGDTFEMPQNNVELVAQWTAAEATKYELTYVANHASATGSAPQGGSYAAGTAITLAANTFVVNDYSFVGWNDGSATYQAGATYAMPQRNVEFKAQWLKLLTIEFEVNGGEAIAPINVLKGKTLADEDIPIASKENYLFFNWFVDCELTEPFLGSTHIFNEDLTLYAAYSELPSQAANTSTYEQTEATLTLQPTDLSFRLVGDTGEVTSANLSDFVTVSAMDNETVPTLTVTDKDFGYLLAPQTAWDEGGSYVIEVQEPWSIEVEVENTILLVSKIYLHIYRDNISTSTYADGIIDITRVDYYYISDDVLYLKNDFAYSSDVDIERGSILAVTDDDGVKEFYKVGNMYSDAALDAVCVELLAPAPDEVYEELDMFEVGGLQSENITDRITEDELSNQAAASDGLRYFSGLVSSAIGDYAALNGIDAPLLRCAEPTPSDIVCTISPMNEEDKDKDITTKEKENGDDNLFTFTYNKRIDIKSNVYAQVSLSITQNICIGYGAKGYVRLTGYNFDIYGLISSHTEITLDVKLYYGNECMDIRSDISAIMNDPDEQGLVADYKKNCALDTDEITIISVDVFTGSIKLSVLEFSFPVTFFVRMDVNAAFAADIDTFVAYKIGARGKKGSGLKSYKEQIFNEYDHEFYYNGHIGLKAGIGFAMEVSFVGLNSLGCIGVGVELGCYFDFYGIGSYEMHRNTILEDGEHTISKWESGNGVYYFEFGIFVALDAYAESDLFGVRAEAKLFEEKFPLFSGGQSEIAVGIKQDDDTIVLYNENTFVLSFKIEMLNLKTRKTRLVNADMSKISVYTSIPGLKSYLKRYDKKTGVVTLFFEGIDKRHDFNVTIAYFGERFAFDGYAYVNYEHNYWKLLPLTSEFKITYLPQGLDIPEEDLDKTYTVTYRLFDEVFYTEQVAIGSLGHLAAMAIEPGTSYARYYGLDKEGLLKDADHIEYIIATDLTRIFEDTVFDASVSYKEYVRVKMRYARGISFMDGTISYIEDTVYAGVGSSFDPELYYVETDQLDNFHIEYAEGDYESKKYLVFKGWDKDGITVPSEDFVCTAVYDAIPVTVSVEVPALYDPLDAERELVGSQYYTLSTYYGIIPEFPIQTHLAYTLLFSKNDFETITYRIRADGPAHFTARWERNGNCSVTVFDHEGNVLTERNDLAYGDNAESIMEEQAVVNYLANLPDNVSDDPKFSKKFGGWIDDEYLDEIVFANLHIKPFFTCEFQRTLLKVDGGKGTIPAYMQYTAEQGLTELKGSEWALDDAFLAEFEPSGYSENGIIYVFSGWEIDKTSGGENVWIYRAQYEAANYSLTVHSNGEVLYYDNGEWKTLSLQSVLANGKTVATFSGSYAEINAIADTLGTNSEVGEPEPTDSKYEFSKWQVLQIAEQWEAYPEFKPKSGAATMIYEIGEGSFSGRQGRYVETIELYGGEVYSVGIDELFDPPKAQSLSWYGIDNNEPVTEYCVYFDDEYYYIEGYWADGDGTAYPNDYTFNLGAGDTVTLYYVYTPVKRAYKTSFTVGIGESFVGMTGY